MTDGAGTRDLPLFFFGTLMDVDVLAQILARSVDPGELVSAVLPRHRRCAVRDRVYPVIRPAVGGGGVEGVLFAPRSAEERARIDHFEVGEYESRPRRVIVGRRTTNALVYVDLEGTFEPLSTPWSFADWRRDHKADYLRACQCWMADYRGATVSVPARPWRAAWSGRRLGPSRAG